MQRQKQRARSRPKYSDWNTESWTISSNSFMLSWHHTGIDVQPNEMSVSPPSASSSTASPAKSPHDNNIVLFHLYVLNCTHILDGWMNGWNARRWCPLVAFLVSHKGALQSLMWEPEYLFAIQLDTVTVNYWTHWKEFTTILISYKFTLMCPLRFYFRMYCKNPNIGQKSKL